MWADDEATVRCRLVAVDQSGRLVAPESVAHFNCNGIGGTSDSPIVDVASGHVLAMFTGAGCEDAADLLDCAGDSSEETEPYFGCGTTRR